MGIILGQRHLGHFRAQPVAGPPDRFIGGVCRHDAPRRRGKGDSDAAERIGRSGPGDDAIHRDALYRGYGVEQFLMLIVRFVAIAFGHQLETGFGCNRERAGPAFVRADSDSACDRLGRLLRQGARRAERRCASTQQGCYLGQLPPRIAAVQKVAFKRRFIPCRHGPILPESRFYLLRRSYRMFPPCK